MEAMPEIVVTSLASTRTVAQDTALPGLYRRLTAIASARGGRVIRFVLAGDDFVDSPSEDVTLEIYVDGLDDEDSRLDLWAAMSEAVEDSVSSPLLLERLALVVHGPTA